MIKLFSLKIVDIQFRRKEHLIFCSNSYCKLNYADFIRRQSLLLNEFTSRLFDRCLNKVQVLLPIQQTPTRIT